MTAASSSTTPVPTLTEVPRRTTRRSTVSALRVRRRKAYVLPGLATLAMAGALTFSTPKPAEAVVGPLMDMCLELVDDWYADCSKGAGNSAQQFACDWLGGVASIGCVFIGAGELGWPILT